MNDEHLHQANSLPREGNGLLVFATLEPPSCPRMLTLRTFVVNPITLCQEFHLAGLNNLAFRYISGKTQIQPSKPLTTVPKLCLRRRQLIAIPQ